MSVEYPQCGTCRAYVRDPRTICEGTCKGGPPMPVALPAGPGQIQIQFVSPRVAITNTACALHQDWPAIEAREPEAPAINGRNLTLPD